MTETIEAAAIMQMGRLYTLPPPARHHDIVKMMTEIDGYPLNPANGDQGFLTNTGRFVGRKQAWRIATEAGQKLNPIETAEGLLFSEHLW